MASRLRVGLLMWMLRLVIIACALEIGCVSVLHAADVAPSTTAAPAAGSSKAIDGLLASWKNRSARAAAVSSEWRLIGQMRSAEFRVNLDKDAPPIGDPIRVTWNGQLLRIAGKCEPAVHLGSEFVPDGTWVTRTSEAEFTGVLNSRLEEQTLRSTEKFPYTIDIDAAREVHVWAPAHRKSPCAAILHAGFSGLVLPYDATKAAQLPALWGLAESLRFAFAPEFLFDEAQWREKGKLLSDRPLVRGLACDAFEYPVPIFPEHKLVCQVWVDPTPNRRLVRAILGPAKSPIVQYDFNYSGKDPTGLVPDRVNVLQLNNHGDPHDELRLARTDMQTGPMNLPVLSPSDPPEGALVVDRIGREVYRVGENRAHQPASVVEIASEFGIKVDLSAVDPSTVSWRQFFANLLWKMFTWPWIVVTLIAGYVSWLSAKRLVRRIRRPTVVTEVAQTSDNSSSTPEQTANVSGT